MAVITISRQLGSGGDTVAALLEEHGLTRSDQQALAALIQKSGIPKDTIQEFDERKPSFWKSFSLDRSRYLHFLRSAIIEVVRPGSAVLVGRGASVILRRVPGVLRVRLVAPEEVRVRQIMKDLDCDQPAAERIMNHSDQDRSGFYRYFFEEDWNKPEQYDVTINTAELSAPDVANLIIQLANAPVYTCEPAVFSRKITDMELEQAVAAHILYDVGIPVRFFVAEATDGAVTIRGIINVPGEENRCASVAREVPGVTTVHTEINFIPDYVGPTW